MNVRRATFTRIYLPHGKYAHLSKDGGFHEAMCEEFLGIEDPRWHPPEVWHGTGSQDEIEQAARMPVHPECLKIMETLYGSPEDTGPAIGSAERPQLESGA